MHKQLSEENITTLLLKFAIPSILSLLVNSLYNIVDQIFIGHSIGPLGNAATTVSFPFILVFMAFALGIGNGGAAYFSILLGQGNKSLPKKVVCTSIILLFSIAFVSFAIAKIFIINFLYIFGATENIFQYAIEYTNIIVYFLPFVMITTGMNAFIRADGHPKYAMYSMSAGAVLNTILDPIFIFYFNWGIKGAAVATVISQLISFIITIRYIKKFKMVNIEILDILNTLKTFSFKITYNIFKYGLANFSIQFIFVLFNITLNNSLKIWGASSIYGSDVPISAMGVMLKVSSIFISIIVGIGLGAQPIIGYNYGAKNYKRVIKTYKLEVIFASFIAIIGFILFMFGTKYIIILFGKTNDLYQRFMNLSFKIYLLCFWFVGFQIVSSHLFQSIGKPLKSLTLLLFRQAIFLIPSILILPHFFGINGILYSGPISDTLAGIITIILIKNEIKSMKKEIYD